jgi:transcriptional regulator with XRE-family HTH domain
MPTEDDLKNLFSLRLSKLMREKNINQNELAITLQVSESTVGKWILKKSMPRMGIIQKLADYFGVGKSYFLEETPQDKYYVDPEVVAMAEQLRTNPNGRILFDASRDLTKEDVNIVLNLINGLKAKEGKND